MNGDRPSKEDASLVQTLPLIRYGAEHEVESGKDLVKARPWPRSSIDFLPLEFALCKVPRGC